MSTGYRPCHNQPEIRRITRMFERGEISGWQFHMLVRECRRKGTEKPEYTDGPQTSHRAQNGEISKALRGTLQARGPQNVAQLCHATGYERNRTQAALHYMRSRGEVMRHGKGGRYTPYVYEYIGKRSPRHYAPWKETPESWDDLPETRLSSS